MNSFSFSMPSKFFFSLCFWEMIILCIDFQVISFFHYFKDVTPLSSLLHCIIQKICCLSYLCPSVGNVSPPSTHPQLLFSIFSLSLVVSNLDYEVFWFSFLHVSCAWAPLSFLDLRIYSFHKIWKMFSHYFFKNLLSTSASLGDPNYMHIRPFKVTLQLTYALFTF